MLIQCTLRKQSTTPQIISWKPIVHRPDENGAALWRPYKLLCCAPVQTVDSSFAYFSVFMHFKHFLALSRSYIFIVCVTHMTSLAVKYATWDGPLTSSVTFKQNCSLQRYKRGQQNHVQSFRSALFILANGLLYCWHIWNTSPAPK